MASTGEVLPEIWLHQHPPELFTDCWWQWGDEWVAETEFSIHPSCYIWDYKSFGDALIFRPHHSHPHYSLMQGKLFLGCLWMVTFSVSALTRSRLEACFWSEPPDHPFMRLIDVQGVHEQALFQIMCSRGHPVYCKNQWVLNSGDQTHGKIQKITDCPPNSQDHSVEPPISLH